MLRVLSLFQSKSYSEQFPCFRTIYEKDLFIPMDCYALSIPVSTSIDMNQDTDIFLDTVLKLFQLNGEYTVNKIKDIMCIDGEFVRFIILRLQEKGFLNHQNQITDEGRRYLSRSFTLSGGDAFISAYAFSRKDSENLLSYIHTQKLQFEKATVKNNSLILSLGTSGKPINIEGRFFPERTDKHPQKRPSASNIRKLISHYNQMCEQSSVYKPIQCQNDYMIDISQDQSIILHCKAVIQEGNSDVLLVSDGFSINCDELAKEIFEKYPDLEKELLSNAVHIVQGGMASLAETENTSKNTPYIEVTRRLSKCFRSDSIDATVDSFDEIIRRNNRRLRELYEAIEWTLLYNARQYPLSMNMLEFFKSHSSSENYSTMESLSEQIGLSTELPKNLLAHLNRAGIERSLVKGIPDIGTLLPLVIVSACEDKSHPLHRAVSEMPDFIIYLERLQFYARQARHEAGADVINDNNLDELEEFVQHLVKILLPDIQVDNNTSKQQVQLYSSASQLRINARFSLSNVLGWEVYQRLDQSLQAELILISPDKKIDELPPTGEFVFSLSRILEFCFRDYIRNNPLRFSTSDKREILNRIENDWNTKIPNGITQVDQRYLEAALNGRNATLNAYYIAFLYQCVESKKIEAKILLDQDSSHLIETISRLRGHTAEAALSYRIDELFPFRDATFRVVKTLAYL